jgi:hypothetical protein
MPVGVKAPEACTEVTVGLITAMFIVVGSLADLFASSVRASMAESSTAGTAFSMTCGFKL